jgi:cold-inducible RNA-binding protein
MPLTLAGGKLEFGMRLYVGNLSYGTTDASLTTAFSAYGNVDEAVVIMDRDTGRSKGFGFVTMNNDEEAKAAMAALDGTDLDGRNIKVNEARPMAERRPSNDRW